jgi:NADPH:quinone reductase-like Zn-dependent oxidoreductase
MRAVRIHGYGGPEMLQVEDVAIPTPAPGQLLVRVMASSINALDWQLREGLHKTSAPICLPFTLGWDFSGIVEYGGPGVARFTAGDSVMGRTHPLAGGAFADYLVAAERDLVAKPRCISHLEAAALPLAGHDAHAALFADSGLQSGTRVLILGGASGVGHLAVQLAKLRGAWVAATTSRQNIDFVRSLGADLVIERDHTDPATRLPPVDLVVDTLGPLPVDAGLQAAPVNDAVLVGLVRLVEQGVLRIEIPRVLPLSRTADALALSQYGYGRGKIVLSVHQM